MVTVLAQPMGEGLRGRPSLSDYNSCLTRVGPLRIGRPPGSVSSINRRLFLLLFLACVLVLNLGCDRRGLNAKDRSEFSPISKGISRASSLLLYEGLPHQFWDNRPIQEGTRGAEDSPLS